MKLHLPKVLLVAVLSVMCVQYADAAIVKDKASITVGNGEGAVTYNATLVTGNSNGGMSSSTILIDGTDTVAFGMTSSVSDGNAPGQGGGNYFSTNDNFKGTIVVYDSNLEDETDEGLVVTNGNTNQVVTFSGAVVGNGTIALPSSSPSSGMTLKFTGDMSSYTGNMKLKGLDKHAFEFDGATSGTGTIDSIGSVKVVDSTMQNSSIKAGKLIVCGVSTFAGDVTANAINTSATITTQGTVDIGSEVNVVNTGTMTPVGELSFSQENGNGFAIGTIAVVNAKNITYAEDLSVKLNGTALNIGGNKGCYATLTDETLSITLDGKTGTFYVNAGNESLAQNAASSYYIASDARLDFSDYIGADVTKQITGSGTLGITIDKSNGHGKSFSAETFQGTVEISKDADGAGNTNLTNYNLGKSAIFKLISGNHWSSGDKIIGHDIVLAGTNRDDFKFRHDGTLELTGQVTGTYLTTGRNYNDDNNNTLVLAGQDSDIGEVYVDRGNLRLKESGKIGVLDAGSGSVTVDANKTLTLGYDSGASIHSIGTVQNSGCINLKQSATLKLGTSAQNLGVLQMGDGAILQGDFDANYRTVTMQKLKVAEGATATLLTQNGDHNGTYDIKSLEGTLSKLVLKNTSSESNTTRFNLGGGTASTYTGDIYLIANQDSGTKRSVALNIKDSTVASGSVIHLLQIPDDSDTQINGNVGLGITTDTTVAGISSADVTMDEVTYTAPETATIVAGEIARDKQEHVSTAETPVTLTINVGARESYNTSATVKDKLNLVKDGSGSQSFSGDMSAFNGSITVKSGELALTSVETLNVTGLSVSSGATLAVALGTIEATGSITLNGGANVIAKAVDLSNAESVSFVVAENSAIALNGAALTMKDGSQFIVALGNCLSDLADGESLTLFTGVSGLTVADSLVFTGDVTSIDLSTWDSSLEEGKYTLSYVVGDVTRTASVGGSLVLTSVKPQEGDTSIPEPATATLSLLALCGLAVRRRRRA